MPRRKSISGVIDPISLIGVLFLIITLSVGTHVVADKKYDFNIFEQAAKPKKTGNSAFDKCREESGREVCNERLGINVNWKGEIVNEIDTSKVDKGADPKDPTCDANGVQYSPGAVVMYGGIGSNATCGQDGKWDVGVGATIDIKQENVPEYAKGSDKLKKQIEDEQKDAQQLATEQIAVEQENLDREKSQCLQEGGSWFANICSYAEQQQAIAKLTPIIQEQQEQKTQAVIQTQPTQQPFQNPVQPKEQQPTTNTQTTNPFANITAGVSGRTIPNASKPYVPPPLPTVPTVEELLSKIPGLEKLNINDVKTLDYPSSPQEENKKIFNWPKLEGLGTYGLGGGNAYVPPVPMNIINSENSSDFYNYAIGNTVSVGAGFASATLLTPGAPVSVFETITAIPRVVQALTLSDLADTAITGALCSQGNQDACAAFTATALIPGPAGSVNLIADSIEDFATSWAGTGSTISKLLNNIPSPALFNPSSSFDSFIPTNTTTDLAQAISPISATIPVTENLTPKVFDATGNNMPKATEITIPTKITNWWDKKITNPISNYLNRPTKLNAEENTLNQILDSYDTYGQRIKNDISISRQGKDEIKTAFDDLTAIANEKGYKVQLVNSEEFVNVRTNNKIVSERINIDNSARISADETTLYVLEHPKVKGLPTDIDGMAHDIGAILLGGKTTKKGMVANFNADFISNSTAGNISLDQVIDKETGKVPSTWLLDSLIKNETPRSLFINNIEVTTSPPLTTRIRDWFGGKSPNIDPIAVAREEISLDYQGTMNRFEESSLYKPKSASRNPKTDLETAFYRDIGKLETVNNPLSFDDAIKNNKYKSNPILDELIRASSLDEINDILARNDIPLIKTKPGELPENASALAFFGIEIHIKPNILESELSMLKPTIVHEAGHILKGDEITKVFDKLNGEDPNSFMNLIQIKNDISVEDYTYVYEARAALHELDNNPNLTKIEKEKLQEIITNAMKQYNWVVFGDVLPTKPTIPQKFTNWWDEKITNPVGNLIFGKKPMIPASQTPTNSKVEDVVSKLNKLMDRVYPESPNLPECRTGLCGWVSDDVEVAFKYNEFKTTQYQVADLNATRGMVSPSFKHAITVIEDDKGNKYLIDLTFSQFINKETIKNPIAAEVFEKGYIKLDDNTLNEYLNLMTSSNVSQPKANLDILEQTKARREVQKYTPEEIKKYYPELVDQETSPPLAGFAKFQEQVGSFGQKVMDGSLSTGAGLSPLKYVAGGAAATFVYLDDYYNFGIVDYIQNNFVSAINHIYSDNEQKTEGAKLDSNKLNPTKPKKVIVAIQKPPEESVQNIRPSECINKEVLDTAVVGGDTGLRYDSKFRPNVVVINDIIKGATYDTWTAAELAPEAVDPVKKWVEWINEQGYSPFISSGYRSYETQEAYSRSYGNQAATPGGSCHQSGLCFDVHFYIDNKTGKRYDLCYDPNLPECLINMNAQEKAQELGIAHPYKWDQPHYMVAVAASPAILPFVQQQPLNKTYINSLNEELLKFQNSCNYTDENRFVSNP